MIDFKPKSLLAFVIAISFVAYYFSIASGNTQLQNVSFSTLLLFVPFFLAFLGLALYRNVRKL